MNHDQHTTDNSIESIPATIESDYDGSEPLDDPAHEAIAQFFAFPVQFRKFKSVSALAENLGVSRMTVYRRAENIDVVQRIKWLLGKSMLFGDLIACREWPGIVKAQVQAALAGDTRAAMFCQNRAWRQSGSILGGVVLEPAIGGADAIATCVEGINEVSQPEELDAAKEDPKMDQGKNTQD
jgi:hypothetical protein